MPQPDEAQQLLEQHIATLDEQKSQLERALAHLKGPAGGEAQGRRQGAGRGKGRPNPGGANAGAAQAPRGARRAEVIADLGANPGSNAAEVATRVGINPNHAQTILGNLVKQGVATKEGQQYTVVAGKG
jgi:predicted transcriptional regulator